MRVILAILFFLTGISASASHIIGGNFKIEQTGANSFDIRLIIFKDCRGGTADLNDIYISVFRADNSTRITDELSFLPVGDTLQLGDDCFSPPSLCVEQYEYLANISLPDLSGGYIISAQLCCRNNIIDNIIDPGNTGMTWSASIPNPALGNSSPDLGDYPSEGFLCINQLRNLDLSASDTDGDSLYYQLVDPYNSPSASVNTIPPQPPPYSTVSWKAGYSTTNAITGPQPLTIDPLTGILKCIPDKLGLFVFAYSVSEYRNGVKIGEVRRDMQLQVLVCEINQKPYFTSPVDSLKSLSVFEKYCFIVSAHDDNPGDSLYLSSKYYPFPNTEGLTEPDDISVSGNSEIEGTICYTPECFDNLALNSMKIEFMVISESCLGIDTAFKTVNISLTPLSEEYRPFFPNVFTPNGDDINDLYVLREAISIPCFEEMEIRIFNRWGSQVYYHPGSDFSWDGKFEGRDVAPGVYYFIAQGSYLGQTFTIKDFLTLNR